MKTIFKKKKFFKSKYFLFFFIIISIFIYFFFYYSNDKFFIINEFKDNFFIVPDEKGGEKIDNLDKKVLHLNSDVDISESKKNTFLLNYSIQLYASKNYKSIKEEILRIEQLIDKKDLFVVIFNHDLGKEYLLLYKNFDDEDVALEYCLNYLKIVDKCIVINAQNLT